MISIRRLASALCLAICFSSPSKAQIAVQDLDPSQTYNTGNIVQPTTASSGSTWTNGVYQDNLTCWGWGDPGYCGPNPIVRPGDNINFSFGSTYIYQEQLLSNFIPSGTGLQIRGYDFSFTAKNGNYWDDARTDQLTALMRFWDPGTGKAIDNLVHANSWSLNYKFDWTNFTFSETFATPYDAASIGRVQYGFIGQDNNGWAGPYGPEIYGVSFNIRYGVDPCAISVLSSPSCPGYLDYITSLSAPSLTIDTVTAPVITETLTQAESIAADPEAQVVQQAATQSAPDTQSASTQSSPSQTTATAAPTSTASAAPTAAPESRNESQKRSGPSLSQIQSIVGNELSRINQLENKTVAETQAQAEAAAQSAQDQAEAIAGGAVAQSIADSQEQAQQAMAQTQSQTGSQENSQQALGGQQRSQSAAASLAAQSQQTEQSQTQQSQTGLLELRPPQNTATQADTPTQSAQSQDSQISAPMTAGSDQQPQDQIAVALPSPPVIPDTESGAVNQYSLLPDRRAEPDTVDYSLIPESSRVAALSVTPRAEDTAELKEIPEEPKAATGPSVRRGGAVDGMNGGDITALAAAPVGFDGYLRSQLTDAPFYAPKEIYKNQRTVDNRRALGALRSDRLHEEMVNQQYNIVQ